MSTLLNLVCYIAFFFGFACLVNLMVSVLFYKDDSLDNNNFVDIDKDEDENLIKNQEKDNGKNKTDIQ